MEYIQQKHIRSVKSHVGVKQWNTFNKKHIRGVISHVGVKKSTANIEADDEQPWISSYLGTWAKVPRLKYPR